MCRSPLCSLVEMFPYIHSLSSSDAAAENKASKTLLGSGNLISISLKKQAGQMVLSSVSCHTQEVVPVGVLGLSH